MLVLLFGKESHIFFCFSVWAVIRLKSVVIVGGFKVHVTYTYGAITRVYLYIYIWKDYCWKYYLSVTLLTLSSLCNH